MAEEPKKIPQVSIPGAPGSNPFISLPWPSAGDRIKAEDFRALSQGLKIIYDAFSISSALFGRSFGEAKLALNSQQYQIQRVMSVFGTEIDALSSSSFDNRKVIQVAPVTLGERQVSVVLSEEVDSRRFAPNLVGLTYAQAVEQIQSRLGDLTNTDPAPAAPSLVGLSLGEALQKIIK